MENEKFVNHDHECDCEECHDEETVQLTTCDQISFLSPTGSQVVTYPNEMFNPNEVLGTFDGMVNNKICCLQNMNSLMRMDASNDEEGIVSIINNAESFLQAAGIWNDKYDEMKNLGMSKALYASMLLYDVDNYCSETIKWCQLYSMSAESHLLNNIKEPKNDDDVFIGDEDLMSIVNDILENDTPHDEQEGDDVE